MKRIEEEQMNFAPVLGESVSCYHRPTKKQVQHMADLGVTHILTLQAEKECPREVQRYCRESGINWLWVELRGANQPLMKSPHTRELLMTGLNKAKLALESGAKLVVHCAAGVHRTGTFLYALLRVCGRAREETLETIKAIREVTHKSCGEARFQLAEGLARRFIEREGLAHEFPMPLAVSVKDLKSPRVLMWTETSLSAELNVVVEVCFTDETLSLCFPIVDLVVRLDLEALRAELGEEWLAEKLARTQRCASIAKELTQETRRLVRALEAAGQTPEVVGRDAEQEYKFLLAFLIPDRGLLRTEPVVIPLSAHGLGLAWQLQQAKAIGT
jgi:protein-tyrosine phosphatase